MANIGRIGFVMAAMAVMSAALLSAAMATSLGISSNLGVSINATQQSGTGTSASAQGIFSQNAAANASAGAGLNASSDIIVDTAAKVSSAANVATDTMANAIAGISGNGNEGNGRSVGALATADAASDSNIYSSQQTNGSIEGSESQAVNASASVQAETSQGSDTGIMTQIQALLEGIIVRISTALRLG